MGVKYVNNILSEISIGWCINDIKERGSMLDYDLSDKECGVILQSLYDHHDANEGINWAVIDIEIEDYKLNNNLIDQS